MALKAEGIWPCTVLGGTFGIDPQKQIPRVQINVRIDDGPSKGAHCTYEDDVTFKSNIYVARSCRAAGWKGGPTGDDLGTLKTDIDAWIKATGGKTTVEIKHIEIKNGKRAGEVWDKPNSLGRGPKPLATPDEKALADAREAMRAARDLEEESAPPVDNIPPPSDDDIPF